MPIEKSKAHEIKRLTTPLTIKDSRAYDDNGKLLNCVETISDVRFIVEPREGILTENEILQYAPESKTAAKIRLKRGVGSNSDVLLVNESVPWIFALYYVVVLSVSVIVFFSAIKMLMVAILVLLILPLVYLYKIFNLKGYTKVKTKKQVKKSQMDSNKTIEEPVIEDTGLQSLKVYAKEIDNLKILFDVKEQVVRDLIKKRFEPPQITYDKFISIIDKANKLFYQEVDSALNIIRLATDDTPRVQSEIQGKINNMKKIINQIEELTNELVINISSDDETKEEVNNLLENMENLIGSVKEY
ncbi:hypothetical protein [Methanobrevibacter sp.]|uniref:hypothetical protein n=1 Tax=Methanobrevibacter sp. TaxID=66852 RepID=UPI00389008DC